MRDSGTRVGIAQATEFFSRVGMKERTELYMKIYYAGIVILVITCLAFTYAFFKLISYIRNYTASATPGIEKITKTHWLYNPTVNWLFNSGYMEWQEIPQQSGQSKWSSSSTNEGKLFTIGMGTGSVLSIVGIMLIILHTGISPSLVA